MFFKSESKQTDVTWGENHFRGYGLVITVNESFGGWLLEINNGTKSIRIETFKKTEAFGWLTEKSIQTLLSLLKKESTCWMRRMNINGVKEIEAAIAILDPAVSLESVVNTQNIERP